MPERLTLEVEPSANHDRVMSRVHVYESSLSNEGKDERLVSLATRGPGLRLTEAQATELRDWLASWLSE